MSEVAPIRELSVDDAPKIAAAISQLVNVGLKPLFPEAEFPDVARRKAEEFEGVSFPDSPSNWAALALAGSEQAFANAIHFQDDFAGEEYEAAEVVASIMALAGDDWPSDTSTTISAAKVVREGRYGPSDRIEIAIQDAAPFDLIVDKYFDWSVVTRLNERLPSGVTGRFAAFFDGNTTVVYLGSDQLTELEELFGRDFMSEIAPPEERPRSQSHVDAPIPRPLPVWPTVFCLLMGGFSAVQLIGIVLTGAPYLGPDQDFTSSSLENTLFGIFVYILGAVIFLGVPLYRLVIRWRALAQATDENLNGS